MELLQQPENKLPPKPSIFVSRVGSRNFKYFATS